ncbi:MAG TPA: isochorismatase family cysteine hydrolase [Polyangiaceae bacterium]
MDQHTEAHFDTCALITIDTQCDTLDGQPLEVPGTSAALPAIRRLADAFRRHRRPIVHVVRIYRPDASNVDLCRRDKILEGLPVLLEGSSGVQIAPDLFQGGAPALESELLLSGGVQQVGPNESIIYKPRWGAFYDTPLERRLRDQDVDTLVFAGCNFPNCPRTSMYEASERDFRVVLAEDALSGLYDRGRSELMNIGVQLLSTAAVVEALDGPHRRTT